MQLFKRPIQLKGRPLIKRPIAAVDLTPIKIDRIAKRMLKIDDAVDRLANGCYTMPNSNAPHYKIRQLCEYAERTGKDTSELSERELSRFLVK